MNILTTEAARRRAAWACAFAALAAATAILVAVRSSVDEAHVAMIFILVVLGGSAWGGRILGFSVAIAAFLVFNWFFLPPYYTLRILDPLDWLVLVVFLITSLVAAQLLYRARAERAAVEKAEGLREAERLKNALLASLSHDLRTPLTTIKGLAHELQTYGDDRALIIEEQADRLNRMVTDMLEMARLEGGAISLDIQVNAVDDLLGAVVNHVAGRPDRHRLEVLLDDPASLSFGRFDFVHSLRILANLVDNALQYAPVDTPIMVTGGREGDAVVIRVSDQGPGVPEGERERIFAPFQRASNTGVTAGSSGLGLSISRRLAEEQGGTLTCREGEGGGALFELRLPAAEPGELI